MIHLLVALLVGPVASAGQPSESTVESTVEVSLIAPDALTSLLTAATGKPRVINFWATWCGPCVSELPILRDYAGANPDVEVVLVNVDVPALHTRKVVPFVHRHELGKLRNVQLDDPDPAMALARVVPGWPDAIPVTSVHRADGTRSALFTHAVSQQELEEAVAAAR